MARIPLFSMRPPDSDDGSSTVARWHAVEIRGGRRCCDAARALAGKRFLPGEAPSLPLPDCDCGSRCECRYRHHEDRRCGPRRAADGAFASPPTGNEDRRHAEGRREQDHEKPFWDEEEAPPPTSTLDDTYYEYVRNSKLFE
jgi:hypothetical protein